MQLALVALAGACFLALVAALAYFGIPDRTPPSPTPQIYVLGPVPPGTPTPDTDWLFDDRPPNATPQHPSTPPANAKGPCACTDEDCPVCKGPKRWRNHCHAFCEGVRDAEPCSAACDPREQACGAGMPRYTCFDNPWVVQEKPCPWYTGFDERRGRECKPGEVDRFYASRKRPF